MLFKTISVICSNFFHSSLRKYSNLQLQTQQFHGEQINMQQFNISKLSSMGENLEKVSRINGAGNNIYIGIIRKYNTKL